MRRLLVATKISLRNHNSPKKNASIDATKSSATGTAASKCRKALRNSTPITMHTSSAVAVQSVIAPAGQELRAVACNVFTPVKGGFSQTQLGNTLSRADKAPLLAGQYILRIAVDGQTAEVPFTIK